MLNQLRFRQIVLVISLVMMAGVFSACRSVPAREAATLAAATPIPAVLPAPTELPVASPTPTATPQPTPALDLSVLTKITPLATDVSPFTGLKVADPDLLQRMPAAVKISNSPLARPQSGLSKADIVIEHLAEGGITRFTAIFHSQDAERIGPVRSARLIDLELPALFDAFLVYSGAHNEVNHLIEASDFSDRTVSDERKDPGFYRLDIPGRAYEHSLFTDSELLAQYAEDKDWTTPPRYRGWRWSKTPAAQASPARTITIPYSAAYSDVTYTYDTGLAAYRRSVLGERQMDDLTKKPLLADNVVVLYVPHVSTEIVEDALGDTSLQIQLWGQGRMQLYRNGTVTEGTWVRPERADPLLFADADMQPLSLKPGNVWIQIVPTDMAVTSAP